MEKYHSVQALDVMIELTLPPYRTILVKFEDGTQERRCYNETVAELQRQGKLDLLSKSYLSPKELEEENSFLNSIRDINGTGQN